MRRWSDDIDPKTIPHAVLKREWARRNSLKRVNFGAGSGRPRIMRRCPACGVDMGSREFRQHRCAPHASPGLRPGQASDRAGMARAAWKTRLVEGGFPDRRFDVEFWQAQGDSAIFRAAWEMVELAEETRHGRKPRLQRTVTHLE